MRKLYLAIILLLCAAGCSKETVDSRIVGKWQYRAAAEEDGFDVTILSDGTSDFGGTDMIARITDGFREWDGDIIVFKSKWSGKDIIHLKILEVTETLMRLEPLPAGREMLFTKR